MGIFFCLRNSGLCHTVCSQPFAECIGNGNLMECHFLVGNGRIVVGKAYVRKIQPLVPLKSFKIIITESTGNLPCPVRPEVKEYNRIMVGNHCHRAAVFLHNRRLHKLICLISVIRCLNAFRPAGCPQTFALCQRVISQLHPVIVIVPVHGIITSHDRGNFTHANFLHLRFQFFGISLAAGRWCISSVQEAVYIDFFKPVSLSQFQQAIEMGIVAVYAAVGQKPEHMKGAVMLFAVIHCIRQRRIFEKCPVFNLFCNSCQFLVHNTPCAHIQMAHFGVPHLPFRQSHCHTTGISPYKRALRHQFVHNGRFCLCHRIAFRFAVKAVSVQNHKYNRFFTHTLFSFISYHEIHEKQSFNRKYYTPFKALSQVSGLPFSCFSDFPLLQTPSCFLTEKQFHGLCIPGNVNHKAATVPVSQSAVKMLCIFIRPCGSQHHPVSL